MFNFKTRKELKERIAFLEKQLEVSERDIEVEKKKWIEEQQYTSLLSNKNKELIKELETMKKEYEETLERRNGVIKILEKDVEILEEKLGKQMEVYYKAKGTIGLREYEAEKAYRKIEQLRKERRRSQENYGKHIKQLKKEKAEIKHELEDEIKTSDSLSWELRDQLEYFPANGFELELDKLCKVGRREYYCDLGKPWAEEILNQMDEKLAEKDEEIAKKDKKIEKLQGFLKYEQKETERLKVDLKVAKSDLRQYEAINLKQLEDRNYWRDKYSKQWAERVRTAGRLKIARKQLRREQELREQDQQKLREEKLRIKMDLKETEETLKATQDSWWEDTQRIERLTKENKKWENWEINTFKGAIEEAVEEATETQKLAFSRLEESTSEIIDNLKKKLEEKEEEIIRLTIGNDKAKVKQEKELTKATEEKIQLAIEKQEALDKMEKLLQDNKRKRNYASGLGKINKVVKIVRHKK